VLSDFSSNSRSLPLIVTTSSNTKEFGKLVTQARTTKGLNRKQLAKQLQVNDKDLADIENGTGKYNGQLVGKCKRTLGLNKQKNN
jgi:ribosome-binding protein aMBF1 (putative translation factor)